MLFSLIWVPKSWTEILKTSRFSISFSYNQNTETKKKTFSSSIWRHHNLTLSFYRAFTRVLNSDWSVTLAWLRTFSFFSLMWLTCKRNKTNEQKQERNTRSKIKWKCEKWTDQLDTSVGQDKIWVPDWNRKNDLSNTERVLYSLSYELMESKII